MKHIKEDSVWKKVYKPYSTKLVKFFSWERIKKDDRPIEERRATGTRKRT